MPVNTVQRRSDHSKGSRTTDSYGHLLGHSHKENCMKKIERYLHRACLNCCRGERSLNSPLQYMDNRERIILYNIARTPFLSGPVAQWLERATHKLLIPGSNPTRLPNIWRFNGALTIYVGVLKGICSLHYCKSTAIGVTISSIFFAASSWECSIG